MVRLYQIFPGDDWGYCGGIVAQHKWGLPGVICPTCAETWAWTGVVYPSIDLSSFPGEQIYRRVTPVKLEVFNERKLRLRNVVPKQTLLLPGTEFGQLVGRMKGKFSDFVWQHSWTLLVQSNTLPQLVALGVHLPKVVPTLLTRSDTNRPELLEFELDPRSVIHPTTFPYRLPQCNDCGRVEVEIPEKVIVRQSSIPSDVDIFRDRLLTTLIFGTERFVEAVKRLGLTGLEFREVDVI